MLCLVSSLSLKGLLEATGVHLLTSLWLIRKFRAVERESPTATCTDDPGTSFVRACHTLFGDSVG